MSTETLTEALPESDTNYWPVMLISIPFAAVLFGIVMIVTATMHPDDVVADDYYKEGMAINQRVEADKLAKTLGATAEMQSLAGNVLTMTLAGVSDSAVQLQFHHVTDKSRDREVWLLPEGDGNVYSVTDDAVVALSEPGVWYLELRGADQDWRLHERVRTPLTELVILP